MISNSSRNAPSRVSEPAQTRAIGRIRKPYSRPELSKYGTIEELTRGGGSTGNVDDPVFDMTPSQP